MDPRHFLYLTPILSFQPALNDSVAFCDLESQSVFITPSNSDLHVLAADLPSPLHTKYFDDSFVESPLILFRVSNALGIQYARLSMDRSLAAILRSPRSIVRSRFSSGFN